MTSKYRKAALVTLVLACGCSRTDSDTLTLLPTDEQWFPEWQPAQVSPQTRATLNAVWVRADGAEGWAVGARGTLLHLSDGRWSAGVLGDARSHWNAVAFDDAGRFGVAVGSGGQVALHGPTDTVWRILTPQLTGEELRGVWVAPDGAEAFVVGHGRTVLRFSGGAWSRVGLPLPSDARLADVAATASDLWVRDSAAVTAVDRRTFALRRRLDEFDASRLWSTRSPDAAWVSGVSYPMRNGRRLPPDKKKQFTIRSYYSGGIDSVPQVPLMPRAAAFTPDLRVGMVAARSERGSGYLAQSVFLNRLGRFTWGVPGSPQIRAMWLHGEGRRGWAVGENGYVARMGQRRLEMRGLEWEYGNIGRLTGWYRARGALPDSTILDSIRLVAGGETVTLLAARDFSTSAVSNGFEFTFMPSAREASLARLKGKSARMQLFFGIPGSDPWYPVGWAKSDAFTVGEGGGPPLRNVLPWVLFTALTLVLLLLARYVRGVLDTVLDPATRDLTGMVGRIARLLLRLRKVRAKILEDYLKRVLELNPPERRDLPALRLREGRCDPLAGQQPASAPALSEVYRAMRNGNAETVLWLQDESDRASDVLRHFGAIVVEESGVPVYVNVHEFGPLKDIATRRLASGAHISTAAAADLLEAGDYVFLVDCIEGKYNDTDVAVFVADARVRNLVVVASRGAPSIGGVCHVEVAAAPQHVEAAAAPQPGGPAAD